MPSRDNVIAFDLEPVSLNLESVPIDELLQFRVGHQAAHKAYMRDLTRFMAELADIGEPKERELLFLERRQEIADTAHELQRNTRMTLGRNLPSWSLGIAGGAWSVVSGGSVRGHIGYAWGRIKFVQCAQEGHCLLVPLSGAANLRTVITISGSDLHPIHKEGGREGLRIQQRSIPFQQLKDPA